MINGVHSAARKEKIDKLLSRQNKERKSIFGRYSNAEMLVQLKRLAQNPCHAEFSHDKIRPLWKQSLFMRRVMALTSFPRRKRKLEHFCKDKLAASLATADGGIRKTRKRPLSYTSSTSCVLNSTNTGGSLGQKTTVGSCNSRSLLTFEDNFQDKLFLDDVMDWKSSAKNLMELADSDESRNGSTRPSPDNLSCQVVMTPDTINGSLINTQSSNRGKKHHLQSARLSTKILNFIDDISRRSVVPVGPRFQADVPEWNGTSLDKSSPNGEDSKNSRWLGSQIWPVKRRSKQTADDVGKGRPDSCFCPSTGSIECIKGHILEKSKILQCDLGPVFSTWKFDEMGEHVLKSWTVKEQDIFEAIVKDPQASGKNFLKHACVSLPLKSSKAIVSYYFNVFVPRRIGQLTRSAHKAVDSDEEEDDSSYMMKYRRKPEGRGTLKCSGGGKPRYLRQPS